MVEYAFGQRIGLPGHLYCTELGVHVGRVVEESAAVVGYSWSQRSYGGRLETIQLPQVEQGTLEK